MCEKKNVGNLKQRRNMSICRARYTNPHTDDSEGNIRALDAIVTCNVFSKAWSAFVIPNFLSCPLGREFWEMIRRGSVPGERGIRREKRVEVKSDCDEVLDDGDWSRCTRSVKEPISLDTRAVKEARRVSNT